MQKRKTDTEFKTEVKKLVGNEYSFLEPYKNAKAKLLVKHNKCGQNYYQSPDSFLQGRRCPNCMRRKANRKEALSDEEFNCKLVSKHGIEYFPLQKYKTSQSKMLFEHLTCGRVFKMRPNVILRGAGCPLCAKEKLADKYRLKDFRKKVKSRWGDQYQIIGKYINYKTPIKVKHLPCDKIYYIQAGKLLSNIECRYCYGNQMLTTREWWGRFSEAVRRRFKLLSDYQGNKQKIRLLCNYCNNKFTKTAQAFAMAPTCPYCGNIGKMNTSIFKFKVAQQTNNYVVVGKYISSHEKIKMRHLSCQSEFLTTPNNFLNGHRCPYCSKRVSKGEQNIENYLKSKNILFETQFRIDDCKDKKTLPFDFAVFNADRSLNCLIEYQGEQHFYDPFTWKRKHGAFNLQSILNTQKHDAMKLQYCKDHGIKLIRINHPQTSSKSNSIEFIADLVKRTLGKELKVS